MSFFSLFLISCSDDNIEDQDVPAGIICEVCEIIVSKTASKCEKCQHPVKESIKSHKKLNRKFSRIFTLDRTDEGIKTRKKDFEKWSKSFNEAKEFKELDQISFPHIAVKRIDSKYTGVNFSLPKGYSQPPSPNTRSLLFEGNQTFNGWLKNESDSYVSIAEVKDGLLDGTFQSWSKGFAGVVKLQSGLYRDGKKESYWDYYFDFFDITRRVYNGKFNNTEYANGIPISKRVSVAVPQWSLSVNKKKNVVYSKYQSVPHGEAVLRDLNNTIISKQYFDHGRLLSAIAWLQDGSIDKRVDVRYGNGSILTDEQELYTFKDGYHVESEIGLLTGPIWIQKKPLPQLLGKNPWTVEGVEQLMNENNCSAKQLIRELNKQSKTGSIFSEDLKISTLLEIFYDSEEELSPVNPLVPFNP